MRSHLDFTRLSKVGDAWIMARAVRASGDEGPGQDRSQVPAGFNVDF